MNTAKPLCVGLTGGIGCGKTTVADLFKRYGVPIVDADEIAHRITAPREIAYQMIVDHFGHTILNPDNRINRKQLRGIIFNNLTEKKWLENYLHPLIRQVMRDTIAQIQHPYCICVIPLLTESNGIDFIDRVLVIDTPVDHQLSRAKTRDDASAESIQKIMDSQASQHDRLAIADDVLINDGDLVSLEDKVVQLHRRYLQIATNR